MKIYMLGIQHNDPLGRSKVREHLETLSKSETDSPAFIAVEWTKDLFDTFGSQRQELRKLAAVQWPNTPREELEMVAQSLGYEADSHNDIFPTAPILWLGAGREKNESEKSKHEYALIWFNIYKMYAKNSGVPVETTGLVDVLSKEAWLDSERYAPKYGWDKGWLDAIRPEVDGKNWAIIIIGANHCLLNDGSLRKLLFDDGFDIIVSFPSPHTPIKYLEKYE